MRKRLLILIGFVFLIVGQVEFYRLAAVRNRPPWPLLALPIFATVLISLSGICLLLYAGFSKGSVNDDLRCLLRKHPRKLALVIGSCFVLLAVISAELGFYVVNHSQASRMRAARRMGSYPKDFYQHSNLLGYEPAPEQRTPWKKIVMGNVAYDVVYTIDAASRRVTPSSAENAKELVLFFGGSFTFGEGVSDNQTMPHYFGESTHDVAICNCAAGGYGPQQMLAQLESGRLDDLVRDRTVVAVYTFIDGHLQRAIGSMHVVTSWGGNMPCYQLDRRDNPTHIGSFNQARVIQTSLHRLCSRSQILKYFRLDVPPYTSESHVHLTARIIEKSAELLAQKSSRCRFCFVFYPGSELVRRLGREFEGSSVQVLDYSKLIDTHDPAYRMKFDGHPPPQLHHIVASQLALDIYGERRTVPADAGTQ